MKSTNIRVVAASVLFTVLGCAPEDRGVFYTEPPPPPAPAVLTTLNVSVPTPTIVVGNTASATATGLDQFGASIATGTVAWSTSDGAVASVDGNGLVMGVAVGQAQVIATASGKTAQAPVGVTLVPVATIDVAPVTATVLVGANQQLTATLRDAASNVLTGRPVIWGSSNASRAAVDQSGMVTAIAAGVTTISATSEGKSGAAQVTVNVPAPVCNSGTALQLAVGDIHALTAPEKAWLCLGGGATETEYALIPFNATGVAASAIPLQITATNTAAILPGSLMSRQLGRTNVLATRKKSPKNSFERSFRERERRDLASVFRSARVPRRAPSTNSTNLAPSFFTGIPANPVVGSIVQINANLTGNSCTSAKQLHSAEVVAVLPNTIVLSDVASPAGGYTNAEMIGFAQAFDTLAYPLAVQNFGVPSDFDANGRTAVLFTPAVNVIPTPPGAMIGGLFAGRDLVPVSVCVASNEGEMFYMPVPDPNQTLNANYPNKAFLANGVLSVLIHEFQHLINAGRRMYVNNASGFEEVWLNEGLSHIAEELLYYRVSANTPGSNIDLALTQSSQAQFDAADAYAVENWYRLLSYWEAPEVNSPFSQTDGLAMRGAIWQLLRYSADRKGGAHQTTWFSLVNSTTVGQPNFNAVFGDIVAQSRDWAVAQFTDDASLGVGANYTHPSWNYRSLIPALNGGSTLLTRVLAAQPVNVTVNGGGAAYLRFRVLANASATLGATSSGQVVPSSVDFILVRTQ
jgi:Bacterial Ig-like domain (group 2)